METIEAGMNHLTPRERFITALERRPFSGRVPHFELVFYLTPLYSEPWNAVGAIAPGCSCPLCRLIHRYADFPEMLNCSR
jgi:hypothetical protein